jgi:membrane protease subunit (stomatin/prohibitin family)
MIEPGGAVGFFDKVRGQFIDIVEFLDDSRDTLVWRFPRQGNEIKMGAQLVVREGQVAVFESEGEIADVFTPGTYTLETENIPILSTLKGWKYGFSSPFKAEVYFVGTRQYTDLKWGTQNPVTVRDAEFGMVRLRAFGTYSLQVVDAARLLRQLVGTDPQFRTDEVSEFLRQNIVSQVGTALAGSNLPMLDLAANQQTIAATLAGTLTANLAGLGISVPRFVIENISLPPEVEAALDKRTQMGVLGNLDDYTRFQTATAIGDAANNPGGAGEGLGLGMGMAMGQQMANALNPQHQQPQPAPPSPPAAPPLPTATASWFIAVDGAQVGPLPVDQLPARVGSGELSASTLVWREGMAAWAPASDVPELRGLFAAAPPPLPPGPPAPPSA